MTTRPETVLRPALVRRDEPRDPAARQDLAARLHGAAVALRLALEIQARCGMHPLTAARTSSLDTHRELAGDGVAYGADDVPPAIRRKLQAAFDELLIKAPCSHCRARLECPAANPAVLQ